MLQLLLVVWILFLVILIDNIKLKQLRHFLNLNKLSVYEQYNYVIICSNLHLTSDFKQFLVQYPQVQIQFFKKSKKNSSFTLLLPYLTSSLTIFGFNENDIFFKLCGFYPTPHRYKQSQPHICENSHLPAPGDYTGKLPAVPPLS